MKSKKFKVGAVAMALVFAMSGSAFAAGGSAAGGTPGSPSDAEYGANADTVFSIFSSSQNAGNMSYTVPLYVTMAVSQGKAEVAVPENYGIINNSKKEGTDEMKIGITGIKFEKLKNSSYNTVEDITAAPAKTDENAIQLSIGGVKMPPLDKKGTFADLTPAAIYAAGSALGTGGASGSPTAIPVGTKLFQLKLDGKVANETGMTRSDSKAVAQFRVRYNVSLLKNDGTVVGGAVYAGSDYKQAGLDDFNVDK